MKTLARTKWLKTNAGYLSICAGIGATLLLYWERPGEMRPEIAIGILAGLLGLFGVLMQVSSSRRQEAERRVHELELAHNQTMRELAMETFEKRREAYEALIKPLKDMILAKVREKPAKLDPIALGELKFELLTYASARTLRAWYEFTQSGEKKGGHLGLIWMGRVMLALREDLGIDNEGIDEIGILSIFINDLHDHEAGLRLIVKEVPW